MYVLTNNNRSLVICNGDSIVGDIFSLFARQIQFHHLPYGSPFWWDRTDHCWVKHHHWMGRNYPLNLLHRFFDLFYGGTFSSTILISYGCFWIGNGLMMLPSIQAPLTATYASEDDIAQANAVYHFIWAIYTLMVTAVSLRFRHGTFILTWCLAWVFCTLFLTGMYYAIGSQALLRTSGECHK